MVEEEADLGGAGVVGVLHQLRDDPGAVGVRVEYVLEPRGERLVLPERLRAAVQLHVDVLGRLREEREAKRSNAHRLRGLRRELGVRQADALGRGEPGRVVESDFGRLDERAGRVGHREAPSEATRVVLVHQRGAECRRGVIRQRPEHPERQIKPRSVEPDAPRVIGEAAQESHVVARAEGVAHAQGGEQRAEAGQVRGQHVKVRFQVERPGKGDGFRPRETRAHPHDPRLPSSGAAGDGVGEFTRVERRREQGVHARDRRGERAADRGILHGRVRLAQRQQLPRERSRGDAPPPPQNVGECGRLRLAREHAHRRRAQPRVVRRARVIRGGDRAGVLRPG